MSVVGATVGLLRDPRGDVDMASWLNLAPGQLLAVFSIRMIPFTMSRIGGLSVCRGRRSHQGQSEGTWLYLVFVKSGRYGLQVQNPSYFRSIHSDDKGCASQP